MDFQVMGVKFGEKAKWEMKFNCGWCKKALPNQTQQSYDDRGNICQRCNVDKSQPSMTAMQIIEAKKKIKEHRETMDLLAEGFDSKGITETERQIIEMKMEEEYKQIVALKHFL